MREIRLYGTTNGDGDLTVSNPSAVFGFLYAVQLIDGSFDDGVDITLTAEEANLSIPLLTVANFNTDQMQYPRVLETLNTSGANLTTHTMPLIAGVPKMVIAAGGDTKSGGCILYIEEE